MTGLNVGNSSSAQTPLKLLDNWAYPVQLIESRACTLQARTAAAAATPLNPSAGTNEVSGDWTPG